MQYNTTQYSTRCGTILGRSWTSGFFGWTAYTGGPHGRGVIPTRRGRVHRVRVKRTSPNQPGTVGFGLQHTKCRDKSRLLPPRCKHRASHPVAHLHNGEADEALNHNVLDHNAAADTALAPQQCPQPPHPLTSWESPPYPTYHKSPPRSWHAQPPAAWC